MSSLRFASSMAMTRELCISMLYFCTPEVFIDT